AAAGAAGGGAVNRPGAIRQAACLGESGHLRRGIQHTQSLVAHSVARGTIWSAALFRRFQFSFRDRPISPASVSQNKIESGGKAPHSKMFITTIVGRRFHGNTGPAGPVT